jgi:hypothetical protein
VIRGGGEDIETEDKIENGQEQNRIKSDVKLDRSVGTSNDKYKNTIR